MKLSIIITLYNRKDLVVRAIKSCLTLALLKSDFEIIVVDDGSDDNPEDVLRGYIDKKDILYFRKKNGGPASAKNYGASKARGKYIIFLDSDDCFSNQDALSDFDLIDKMKMDFAFSESVLIKHGQDTILKTTPFDGDNLFDYVLQYPLNYPGMQLYIFRRDKFINCHGFNEDHRWGDALLFWREFLGECKSFAIEKPTCIYHITEASVSRTKDAGYHQRVLKTINDTYITKKETITKHGYSANWLLVLIGLSLLAKDYKLLLRASLSFISNPNSAVRAVKYVCSRRLNRG